MTPKPVNKKRTKNRVVFHKQIQSRKDIIIRQSFESILMLSVGSLVLYIINSIPNREDWFNKINDVWITFLEGLTKVISSIITFGASFVVVISMICGIILIFGGLIRLIRVISYVISMRK